MMEGVENMLRFVICEDNKDFLNRLSNSIIKVMMSYNFEYKINKFTQYNKEVEEIISNKDELKIYILDIELPEISGLEIASMIREDDLESIVIFVTAHLEFKNDIFYSRLLALDYIAKDRYWEERFEKTISYTIKKLNKKRVLMFEYNYNSYRIPYDSIVYIEKVSDNRKCLIHTEDNSCFEIGMTISDLLKELGPNFYRTHKSCIVNLDKVKKINYSENIITFTNGVSEYLLSNRNKKGLKDYVGNY